MPLGPKYGHKCLLHTHNIHTTVLRQQNHNTGNNMFLSFSVFAYPILHLEKLKFCFVISFTEYFFLSLDY